MVNIVRAPFFVPSPGVDAIWSGAPVDSIVLPILTQQKMFGAGGQVVEKRWTMSYTYDHATLWSGAPIDSTILQFLTKQKMFNAPGQVVDTYWPPLYTYDDPAVWTGSPDPSAAIPLLTQQRFYGANGQAPNRQRRYDWDDASAWQFKAPHNSSLSVQPSPFVPALWDYNEDDQPLWNAAPIDSTLLSFLTQQRFFGASGQVPIKRWSPSYTFDDASVWYATPDPSAAIPLLTQQRFYGVNGQVPTKGWWWDWDDQSSWQFKAPRNGALLVQPQPFGPDFWRYLEDDQPFWSAAPVDSTILQSLTQQRFFGANGQVPTKRWSYDWDNAGVWNASPIDSTVLPFLTQQRFFGAGGQGPPKQWRYDFDDAAVWYTWTSRVLVSSQPIPKPLTVPAQQFVISSDEPWTLTTQRNLETATVVPSPLKAVRARIDLDDQSYWYAWVNRNLVDLVVAPAPFSSRARPSYDEVTPWQWVSRSVSAAMSAVPLRGVRRDAGLVDDSPWQFSPQGTVGRFLPHPSVFLFVSRKWGLDIPQDTPTTLHSWPSLLLQLLYRFVPSARRASTASESRTEALPTTYRVSTTLGENRNVSLQTESRTQTVAAENRKSKTTPGT